MDGCTITGPEQQFLNFTGLGGALLTGLFGHCSVKAKSETNLRLKFYHHASNSFVRCLQSESHLYKQAIFCALALTLTDHGCIKFDSNPSKAG